MEIIFNLDLRKTDVPYELSFGCMHLRCCRAYTYEQNKVSQGLNNDVTKLYLPIS